MEDVTAVQEPLLVRTGLRNWKRKTVPVGRSLMRFPAPVKALPETPDDFVWDVVRVSVFEAEVEVEAPI